MPLSKPRDFKGLVLSGILIGFFVGSGNIGGEVSDGVAVGVTLFSGVGELEGLLGGEVVPSEVVGVVAEVSL